MRADRDRRLTVPWVWCIATLAVLSSGCSCRHLPTLDDCFRCVEERARNGAIEGSAGCRLCMEIRARDPRAHDATTLRAAYAEEYAYIESRRRGRVENGNVLGVETQRAPQDNGLPPHLIGLALSGGGIRSASISLGALQALDDTHVFRQLDYMSAVSGGGYVAGWLQAHLGAQQLVTRDRYAYNVGAADPTELLANHGDHIEHLRTHTGFLNQGGWFEASSMVWDWVERWPFHLVMDDIFHLRGRDPWYHVLPIYENRIQGTYFRGTPEQRRSIHPIPEVRLADINARDRADLTPYVIINGNLTNVGQSQIGVHRMAEDAWNFEFTRDFVGSDGTGYVASQGFGLPVARVYRNRDCPKEQRAPSGTCLAPTAQRGSEHPVVAVLAPGSPDVSPFRLSQAVAASGAAFDSQTIAGKYLNYPVLREAVQGIGGGLLNLHLGLDIPNFARSLNGPAWTFLDYSRMMTYQRIPKLVDTGARWLYVTDGGFYENLGVLSLLRRGVPCIVAVDSTADAGRSYEDLQTLRQRVESDLGLRWMSHLPATGSDLQSAYRFQIGDVQGNPYAVVLYLKASADPELRHLKNIDRFLEQSRQTYYSIVHNLLAEILQRKPAPDETEGLKRRVDAYYAALHQAQAIRENERKVREAQTGDVKSQLATAEARLIVVQSRADTLAQQRAAIQPEPTATATAAEAPPAAEATAERALPNEVARTVDPEKQQLKEQTTQLKGEIDRLHGTLATLNPAPSATARSIAEALPTDTLPYSSPEVLQARADINAAVEVLKSPHAPAAAFQHFDEARRRIEARLADYFQDGKGARSRNADRLTNIERIDAFAAENPSFPHDSTARQYYEWERFESYRMLGYQTVTTYIGELYPGTVQDDLDWCDFAVPDDTARTAGLRR